jgi:hypothetical protein
MLKPVRTAAHWVGRHAFPAIAATVVAVGAAGGGIGYAVASQHSTAAPVSSTSGSTGTTPAPGAKPKTGTAASRGAQLMQQALSLLATQTGQSVASVRSQLQAGKSIDDIAGAKAPAIESEILAQLNKLAARAVSAGKITAAQEANGLAMAKTKVEALMAEPGTQLLKDAQKFLQLLENPGAHHHAAGTAPSPFPAP